MSKHDKHLVQLDIKCGSYLPYESCSKSKSVHYLDFITSGWRYLIKPCELRAINGKGFSEIHPNVLILGME